MFFSPCTLHSDYQKKNYNGKHEKKKNLYNNVGNGETLSDDKLIWAWSDYFTWWAVMLIKIQSYYLLISDFQGLERGSLRSSICLLIGPRGEGPTYKQFVLGLMDFSRYLHYTFFFFFFSAWFEVLKKEQHLPQIQSSFWISANQLHGRSACFGLQQYFSTRI